MKKFFTKMFLLTAIALLGVGSINAGSFYFIDPPSTSGQTSFDFGAGNSVTFSAANRNANNICVPATHRFQMENCTLTLAEAVSSISVIGQSSGSTIRNLSSLSINGNSINLESITTSSTIDGSCGEILISGFTAPAGSSFEIVFGGAVRVSGFETVVAAVVSTPLISSFTIEGITATIDNTAETITAELPYGTDLTALTPVVELGGTGFSYTPTGVQDFSTTINYTVSNEDGDATKTYAVTITTSTTASSDATLSNLLVNGVSIDNFDPAETEYTVTLPFGTTTIPVVSAEQNYPTAIASVEQAVEIFGTATVTIIAEDGITTETYTINFVEAPNVVSLYFATGSTTNNFTNTATGELSGDVCSVSANNSSPHCLPDGITSGRRTGNITAFSITLNSIAAQDIIFYLRAGGSNPVRELTKVEVDGADVTEMLTISNNSISSSGCTPLTIEGLNTELGAEIAFTFNATVILNYLTVTPVAGSGVPSNLTTPATTKAIQSVQYYDTLGRAVDASTQGMVIIKTIYEDGSFETAKVYNSVK